MNLDALLHVFYLDVYDLFSRPQTRILRGIAVHTLGLLHCIVSLHFDEKNFPKKIRMEIGNVANFITFYLPLQFASYRFILARKISQM